MAQTPLDIKTDESSSTPSQTVSSTAQSNDISDCEICHQIWTRLTTSPSGKYHDTVNLGSFEEALSSKCSRHVPIVRMFHELCSKSRQLKSLDSADVGIRFPRTGALQLTENIKTGGRYADLLLVKRDSIPSHPGIARILDPEWIDTSVVTPWKQQCASSHGPKCANPVKIWPIRPAWVVDTERRCIVPGDGCESYVTLSYRWGKTPGLHILGDTISKLQTPGDIDDPFIASQLAPMVRHAVHLTSVIGERYLWVDTLCINHARAEESNQQLQLMAAIFANASLTIVALDGDAEDGFPGLRGVSSPKDQADQGEDEGWSPIPFGDEQFIRDKNNVFSLSHWGAYHERAWTYQEFKMSPRRLIVSNHSLHWMCQCSVWEEQLHLGVEAGKYIDPRLGEIMRGMPNLDSLANIVVDYNPRALTYDEDALPSISGLLHVISRCFSGGFLYGIPEMYFEAALGWTPYWCHTDLRRRTVSDRPTASQLGPCGLPSWSWVGWEGLVSVGRNEAGPANPLAYSIRETIPITTWYACATPTSAQRRKIRSSWFENRQAYKDFTRPLPPGWTRQEIPGHGEEGDVLLYPDGCDKYTFRHSSMSDHDDEHPWYWPFPVPDIQESTQPFMPEQTLYISCDTRRARVSAFQADEHNDVSLYSEEKKIGGLRLHNKGQLESFPQLDAGWAAAKEVELVAISRVRNYKKTFDETIKRYTHPFTASEVYSVLWVEWIDGVAYRLASGHVDKTAWEGLPLEDVSLILG